MKFVEQSPIIEILFCANVVFSLMFAVVGIYGFYTGSDYWWAVLLFLIWTGWAATSTFGVIRKNRKVTEERKQMFTLLDPILSSGMSEEEAIQEISQRFEVSRPPRHYSVPRSSKSIEVDTPEVTFIVSTTNGVVKRWSSK